MKPLNHREINQAFTNFVIAGIITLGIVIFSFYFTNEFLTQAVAEKKIEEYGRFQQYKRRQKLYVQRLEEINQSLASPLPSLQLVTDFKLLFKGYGDTTLLMNKIVRLSTDNIGLSDNKNTVKSEMIRMTQELKACKEKLITKPE